MATVQKSAATAGVSIDSPVSTQHKTEAINRMAAQTKELQSGESGKQVHQQTTQKDVEREQEKLNKHMFTTVVSHGLNNVAENTKAASEQITEYVENKLSNTDSGG